MIIKFVIDNDPYSAKSYLSSSLNLTNLIDYNFLNLDELINKISQLDFFNESKNYFINGLNFNKKEENFLIDLINNYSLNNDLYFYIDESNKKIVKFINDHFKKDILNIVKFNKNNKYQFVKNYFTKELNLNNFNDPDLYEIVELLPDEYNACINELNKLKLLNQADFNVQNIKNIIYKDDEVNLFNLCELILNKHYLESLRILNNIEDDQFYLKLISLLANYFYKMIVYKLLFAKCKDKLNFVFKNP
ncbi:hypothetical protein IKS57_06145 [bacterium]|nr:hypothetical protein [bacterium]